eukprot:TRINITY_DN2661_c0_g1_i1.p1 TRINITY_DN2661_c0_g1~~TRINITY_DN2661_c0_g1_i1.p1  ORF type:complete len:295 (-),score=31.69 TRINITY_DN2661_c0_g1_i1:5-889(-)
MSASPDYESMKIPELKEILRSRGLKVGGNKAELIDRLEGREIATSSSRKRKAGDGDTNEVHPSIDVSFASQVEREDVKTITIAPLRTKLKKFIRSFHKLVNEDWHDGYEGQEQVLQKILDDTIYPVYEAIINIADKGVGFQYCNEVLVVVADWWDEIHSIDVRFEYSEMRFSEELISEGYGLEVKKFNKAIAYMWGYILFGAVKNNIDQRVIYQIIADAKSFGWDEDEVFREFTYADDLKASQKRLENIINSNEWKICKGRKKAYSGKRVIDARFDGPLHKRKRDYHLKNAFGE